MKQTKRIIQNSLIVTVGSTTSAFLNFAVAILIARFLGTEDFGHYSFIIAFTGLFQLFADSGLRNILIRNISINKENLEREFGLTRALVWILSLAAMAIIVVVINLINPTQEVLYSTYLAGVGVIAIFHAATYGAVIRAFEEMGLLMVGANLHKVIFGGLVFLITEMKWGLPGICLSLLLSNLFLWAYNYSIVRLRYVTPKLLFERKACLSLLSESIPLGIAEILRKATWQIDILILTWLTSAYYVGLYSASYKIIQAVNLFALTLAIPFYPAFSRLAKISSERLLASYEKSFKFLCVFSIPLATGITLFSHNIIGTFFGQEFLPAAPALKILSWTIFFIFPTSFYIYLFTAMGKQRLYTICTGTCLGINILLDLLLIPSYNYIGASIATLISEAILFMVGLYLLQKEGYRVFLVRLLWKPVTGSLIMGFFLYQVETSTIPWLLMKAVSGGIIYTVVILLLQTFSREEITLIKESIGLKPGLLISNRR